MFLMTLFCLQVKKRQQESSLHRYCRQTVGKGIIKHEEEMDTKDMRDHAPACPLCLPKEDYDPAYIRHAMQQRKF